MARRKTIEDYRQEIADLKDENTDLQEENEGLQDQLDQIVVVASGEEEKRTKTRTKTTRNDPPGGRRRWRKETVTDRALRYRANASLRRELVSARSVGADGTLRSATSTAMRNT